MHYIYLPTIVYNYIQLYTPKLVVITLSTILTLSIVCLRIFNDLSKNSATLCNPSFTVYVHIYANINSLARHKSSKV